VFVLGSHLGCSAFKRLLHASLRALIDGLGVSTFNVAALNVDVTVSHPHARLLELVADECGRSAAAGDGTSTSGSSEHQRQREQLLLQVRPLSMDDLWIPAAFSASASAPTSSSSGSSSSPKAPVVVRLVSRGKLDSIASDFGGLEVFGGASIGHTDPYRVVEAINQQLALM